MSVGRVSKVRLAECCLPAEAADKAAESCTGRAVAERALSDLCLILGYGLSPFCLWINTCFLFLLHSHLLTIISEITLTCKKKNGFFTGTLKYFSWCLLLPRINLYLGETKDEFQLIPLLAGLLATQILEQIVS